MGESASLKPLDAIVDAGAAPEEMAAVESVFRAANVPATVRDDYVRLSAEVLLTEMKDDELLKLVALDLNKALKEA